MVFLLVSGFIGHRRCQLITTSQNVLILMSIIASSLFRMASFGKLRRVAHVRTDFSEELSASIIRVTRIDELTGNVVPSSPILVTLMM
jgi:hypothetical protein